MPDLAAGELEQLGDDEGAGLMSPFALALMDLLEKLGEAAVQALLSRGAEHPDTPATHSDAVKELASKPLATDAVEQRAEAIAAGQTPPAPATSSSTEASTSTTTTTVADLSKGQLPTDDVEARAAALAAGGTEPPPITKPGA